MDNKKQIYELSGLKSFIFMANYYGINVSEKQLLESLDIDEYGMKEVEMLKAAKKIRLKAQIWKPKKKCLKNLPLPAIIKTNDDEFLILAKIEEGKVLIYHLYKNAPEVVSTENFKDMWSGIAVVLADKSFFDKNVAFGIRWFIPTILKYKRPLIEVLIAVFILQILGIFTPLLTQAVVDKALVNNNVSTLYVFVAGIAIVIVFELLMGLAKNYVFTNTTSKIDVILGARLYNHLFSLPLRYFETRRVGDTIARVHEVENIRTFLTGTPLTTLLDVNFMVVYIIVLFMYSPSLTGIVLASLPIFAILSLIVTPLFKRRLDDRFNAGAEYQSFLVESVTGAQTVKSMALEPVMQHKWEDRLADYSKASYKTAVLSGNAGVLGQTVQKVFDLLILLFGAKMVMEGNFTVGQLIAFRMLSSRVSTPVLRLVQLWQEFQQASLSIKRLGDIFNEKPEANVTDSKTDMPNIKGNISFEKVDFRYKADQAETIRNMSFNIKAGQVIGIVGRSGSGKSTLSKLVQRLYVPERGKICIDGSDIALADPRWLRRQIGVVLQENFLFNMTVKDNICIHYKSASTEEVIRAAKISGAHDFITQLPNGYDTMIGERGIGLSGGQRQRIAIARALITNPKILIFDEATSALDYESENIIQNNLKMICHGRTVLIIAHRLSTIKDADEVMVIDKGSLVEYDTPQKLLENKGLFYYLNEQQKKGARC